MIRRVWLVVCLMGLLQAEGPDSLTPQVEIRRPEIASVFPMSGQPGRSVPFEIRGEFLDRAEQVRAESADLTGAIESASLTRVTGTFQVAAEAKPGPRYFRLITPRGASNLLVFRVTAWPEFEENDSAKGLFSATPVSLPALASGRLAADVIGRNFGGEEADLYRFRAKPGDRLQLTVLGVRNWIQSDLTLTLLRADGRQLDFDEGLFLWDPYLDYTFTGGGDYIAAVTMSRTLTAQTSKYDTVNYQLAIGDAPIAWSIFPMGMRRGEVYEGELRADFASQHAQLIFDQEGLTGRLEETAEEGLYKLRLEAAEHTQVGWHRLHIADPSGTQAPVPFHVGDLPERREQEPNDSRDQAEVLSWPALVNGRMDRRNDHDTYRLQAKAGEWLAFEVNGKNAAGSQMDATLKLLDAEGTVLSVADDQGKTGSQDNRDPLLVHRFGWDGVYYLQIESVYRQHGPDQNYRLTVRRPNPRFRLEISGGGRRGLPGPSVPQGGEGKLALSVTRLEGFECEIEVSVRGLPQGVTAKPLSLGASADSGTLEIAAADDAQLGVTPIEITGRGWDYHSGEEIVSRVVVEGNPWMGEGPGFVEYTTPQPLLSVVKPTLFSLETMLRTVVIVRGQTAEVPVQVTRQTGFQEPLDFSIENLPPGVKLKGWEELDEGKQVKLLLQADEQGTPLRHSDFVVIAQARSADGIILESAPAVGFQLD